MHFLIPIYVLNNKPDLQGVPEVDGDECIAWTSLSEEEKVEVEEDKVEEGRDTKQIHTSQQCM